MQLTPDVPLRDWRLRPRDGDPRALIEKLAQQAWRYRIEAALVFIAVMVTLTFLIDAGTL